MRILVVKLTSMGDVLHLMPALSDLQQQHPGAVVDWMVEDSFGEIPTWHPMVRRVIIVSTRRWRSLSLSNVKEFFTFFRELRAESYDIVIDAQGLMKSAVFSRFAKLAPNGLRAGFSADSIKESPAARWYKKQIVVDRHQHAIKRLRALFAGVFDYTEMHSDVDYNISLGVRNKNHAAKSAVASVMLLHGTTWPTKHLPDEIWTELADLIADDGYAIKVCWGNEHERQRAERIAQGRAHVTVLPKSSLSELAIEISETAGVIAVDTGLGHLAAALSIPTVSVYGSTDANLTGTVGNYQVHIQTDYPCSPCMLKKCNKLTEQIVLPPCYKGLTAIDIWQTLYQQIV